MMREFSIGHLRFAVLLIGMAARIAVAAEVISLDSFNYPDAAAAQQAWRAINGAPGVAPAKTGLLFPLPFADDVARVCWDKAARLDLDGYSSFELDVTCLAPEALRSLAIYFKSGAGWYVWNQPVPKRGRQIIRMLKGDFSTEGKPAGWAHIEAVRISPWKGAALNSALTFHAFQARADQLLLVQGTLSAPDATARAVSKKVTQRISNWLRELGIAHGVVDDEAVQAGALNRARLAILCYNAYPPQRELAALQAFLKRGGKLIVFYSSSPELAATMHMRLDNYIRAEAAGQWSALVFTEPQSWNTPARIYQDSPNLVPVAPADRTAQVIAWWEDAAGARRPEAAWVASAQGLWMSHILMNDDARNKKEMLLGLIGHYDPTIWDNAARAALAAVGRIDSFRNFDDALSVLRGQAGNAADPKQVNRLLDEARDLHAAMRQAYERGRYPEMMAAERELTRNLIEGYAAVQHPKPGEFRAVWDHDGVGWFPGNWPRTCRILAENGINAIFVNLLWGGLAHFPCESLPPSATLKKYGDQLRQSVQAAHAQGLELHVWQVCWNLSGAPTDFVENLKQQGRLQLSAANKTVPWLCPSHPKNQELALAGLKAAAADYPIDGIHLDYVRFPDSTLCYCATCRREFEETIGQKVRRWPQDAQAGGALAPRFQIWRAGQITRFVRAVHDAIKDINPKIKISAAVFSQYPSCIGSVGQDWGAWLKAGYLDFVCPMNYTTDPIRFTQWTQSQLALPAAKGRVYPGLGVTADESQLAPDQVIEQILIARRCGATGFVLFDLSGTLQREVLPLLSLGLTK